MQKIITISTDRQNGLYDITSEVVSLIKLSKVKTGIASIYARGSTAAIMIQENWDQSVQNDVITLLKKMIPSGIWQHDEQDNNGDAHLTLVRSVQILSHGDAGPSLQCPKALELGKHRFRIRLFQTGKKIFF